MQWVLGAAAAAVLAVLTLVPAAQADFPSLYGGDIGCAAQPGKATSASAAARPRPGTAKPDRRQRRPAAAAGRGPDGPYPLIGVFHGWGGRKIGLEDARRPGLGRTRLRRLQHERPRLGRLLRRHDPDRLLEPEACAAGYNHLLDTRYEVRDAQYLISVLADEGVAEPDEIGATGVSYGGGMSMALAALRNRTMLPDGSWSPGRARTARRWNSPPRCRSGPGATSPTR